MLTFLTYGPILFIQKITLPELMVCIKEMSALISSVTMHSVRIYHEVKLLGFLVESIKKLKAKTKYYVQVRSYAKVGGKLYTSSWSKKKAVKTK
jgi:hypothetical protein